MFKKERLNVLGLEDAGESTVFWLSDESGQTSFLSGHITDEMQISGIKYIEGKLDSDTEFSASMSIDNIGLFVLKHIDKDESDPDKIDPFDVSARLKGLRVDDNTK